MRRDLLALLDQLVAGFEECLAADQGGFRTTGAAADLQLIRVALQQPEPIDGDTELLAEHLCKRRRMPLAVVERTREHGDRAVFLETDAAIFLAGRAGDLEILTDATAAQFAQPGALDLAFLKTFPVGDLYRLVENGGELARVVVHSRWRLVRHLLGRDVIAATQLRAIDAYFARGSVDQPLH